MEYRLNKQTLTELLGQWNAFLKRKVHLIASKLFRGTVVDFEDCLMLMKSRKENIDLTRVEQHVKELASYDISENRIIVNLEYFLNQARKESPYG